MGADGHFGPTAPLDQQAKKKVTKVTVVKNSDHKEKGPPLHEGEVGPPLATLGSAVPSTYSVHVQASRPGDPGRGPSEMC